MSTELQWIARHQDKIKLYKTCMASSYTKELGISINNWKVNIVVFVSLNRKKNTLAKTDVTRLFRKENKNLT